MNNNKRLDGAISFIISQTNYTKTEALEKLKEEDNNYMQVIRKYLNPNLKKKEEKKEENKGSINKMIMDEYRMFLDNVNKQYSYRKNVEKQYELFKQRSNKLNNDRINEYTKEIDKKDVDIEEID